MSTETGIAPERPDQIEPTNALVSLERELTRRGAPVDSDGDAAPPSETEPRRARVASALRFTGPIVALVIGIKVLVYSFGVVVAETMGGRAFEHFTDRFAMWNVWDAPHYLALAEHGYQRTGDPANFIVFFPGFPLAIRVADFVVPGDLLAAAFVVSGVASVAAALLLGQLARLDGAGNEQATRAVWFFLIFPTAYFLHLPYTESLFLTFLLGAFVAARTGHWRTAGVIGMLAAFTRLNGALLLPALALEAYLQFRKTRRFDPAWLWIGFIALGTLIYLAINQHSFGDPLHFQDVQRDNWSRHLQSPITSVKGMVDGLYGWKPGDREMFVIQELLFLGIGLVAGIAALRWSRPSYAAWVLLNVLLFASTSWIQSTPRYALTLFPIFLMLAQIKRQWIVMLASAWSLAMFAWFAAIFAQGGWAF